MPKTWADQWSSINGDHWSPLIADHWSARFFGEAAYDVPEAGVWSPPEAGSFSRVNRVVSFSSSSMILSISAGLPPEAGIKPYAGVCMDRSNMATLYANAQWHQLSLPAAASRKIARSSPHGPVSACFKSTPVAVEPSAVLAHPHELELIGKRPAHPSDILLPVDSLLGELRPPQQSMPPEMDRLCLRDEIQDRIPFWNPPPRPPPNHLLQRSGVVARQRLRARGWGYIKPTLEEKRLRVVLNAV